jgi:heptosyltransferase-1
MRIAIVKLSALGDIIHTLVMLEFIKQKYPNAMIDWVVEVRFKGILLNVPNINQIYTVDLKAAKEKKSVKMLLKEIKKLKNLKKYDIVIDAQGLLKSAVLAKFIPAWQIWGFDRRAIREKIASFFYTHHVDIAYDENIIQRNRVLFNKALGLKVTQAMLLKKQAFLRKESINKNYEIILVLGASFASKQYPVEQFAKVVKLLTISPIVVWGCEAERILAQKLQQLAPSVRISRALNLSELSILIGGASLLIGGDTGPAHMAWASNTPSILLFGSTPAYRNALVTPINKILESNSIVDPFKIDKTDISIRDISPNQVADLAKALLESA